MQKTYLKLSLLAVLVAGATMAISCSKDENEVNNEVSPSMQTKLGIFTPEFEEVPNDSILFQHRIVDPWHLYWQKKYVVNNEGEKDTILVCDIGYIDMLESAICAVSLNKPQEPEAAFTTLNIYDNHIQSIVMEEERMDPYLVEQYIDFSARGIIEFAVDCPITDVDVLKLINKDHIPAGKYPIYRENNKFIIGIEE